MSDPAGFNAPPARPWSVTAAGWVTIVCSGLVLLVLGIAFLAAGISLAGQHTARDRSSLELVVACSAAGSVWCVAAIVLAWTAMRRSRVARLLSVVSAAVSAVVSTILGFFVIVPFVLALASVAAIVLFVAGEAGPWYRHDAERAELPLGTTWG